MRIKGMYAGNDCSAWERYGTDEVLDLFVDSKNKEDRIYVIDNYSYGLDKLVHDSDSDVRRAVLNKRYGLDVLINDSEKDIRDRAFKLAGMQYRPYNTFSEWAAVDICDVVKEHFGEELDFNKVVDSLRNTSEFVYNPKKKYALSRVTDSLSEGNNAFVHLSGVNLIFTM